MDKFDEELLQAEPLGAEELEIFGRSKSREEIAQEKKAQRAKEIRALRDARVAAKEAKKAAPKGSRKDMLIVLIVFAVVILIGALAIGRSIAKANEAQKYEYDDKNPGYYVDEDILPELSNDGVTAEIREAYYTKGGYLYVLLVLGNGDDRTLRLNSVEITIQNGNTDALIAQGFFEGIVAEGGGDLTVPAQDYVVHEFYIKPEHVKITDDSLNVLTYSIDTNATTVEE